MRVRTKIISADVQQSRVMAAVVQLLRWVRRLKTVHADVVLECHAYTRVDVETKLGEHFRGHVVGTVT